jgi:hypothetical protein
MPSVAERIYTALADRLRNIRGQGCMSEDLQGRIYMQRPDYDLDAESYPAAFIAPRQGSGFQFTQKPGSSELSATTLTFDVVGVIGASKDTTAAVKGLRLMADLHRALEVQSDLNLEVTIDGVKVRLLSEELRIVDAQYEPAPSGFDFEVVGVGVACVFPQKYGDPDYVAP